MTTQEFITKEKNRIVNEVFHPATDYSESKLLAKQEFGNGIITGLTKGLEIAVLFLVWVHENGYEPYGGNTWFIFSSNEDIKTTSELLTIFLTEKYGK